MNFKHILKKVRQSVGFTMIELLIVIAILGILAVAVLSAIDPVEQINRGRDTGTRSDAEQLISAIDRLYAFRGYYPWQTGSDDAANVRIDSTGTGTALAANTQTLPLSVKSATFADTTDCNVFDKLGAGTAVTTCVGANEIKEAFQTRVTDPETRSMYVYNEGNTGDSTYVCFIPQSGAFQEEAKDRCLQADGVTPRIDLPDDFPPACNTVDIDGVTGNDWMICLP